MDKRINRTLRVHFGSLGTRQQQRRQALWRADAVLSMNGVTDDFSEDVNEMVVVREQVPLQPAEFVCLQLYANPQTTHTPTHTTHGRHTRSQGYFSRLNMMICRNSRMHDVPFEYDEVEHYDLMGYEFMT